jgi:hypothetical protein
MAKQASTARSGIIMSAVEATAETAAGRDFIRDIIAPISRRRTLRTRS